jgi:phosphoglycerate kinase
MSFPRLEDLEGLDGAAALLRLDLNVPVADGKVLDATRVEAAVETVAWLMERARVVAACSHLGKAKGKPDPAFSLRPVAEVLASAISAPVRFVADCSGPEVAEAVASAQPGTILLLENLRFHSGESANDPEFARALTQPFSHYVNDAFGTAHRAHASVVAAVSSFPAGKKAAGRLMQMELDSLVCLMSRSEHPFVAVIGGAKISTKTAPLEALVERVDVLAIGGGMANTFLRARGCEVGRSLVEEDMVDAAREVMQRAAERGIELLIPEDVIIADSIDEPTWIKTVSSREVPSGALIVDIGPQTRRRFTEVATSARSAFWNGPMGVFERQDFAEGTMAVARALAACKGFTVVGGGESVMAVHRAGVGDRLSHVSTGGGASLKLIAGEVLPAVAALEA